MTVSVLVILAALFLIYSPVRVMAVLCILLLVYSNPIPAIGTLIVLGAIYYFFKK